MHTILLCFAFALLCLASISFAEPATRPVDPAWRNVRDFGAAGDGTTDDTTAFQRALDEAGKTGDRVFVPSGI
jgi:polygalacturonase